MTSRTVYHREYYHRRRKAKQHGLQLVPEQGTLFEDFEPKSDQRQSRKRAIKPEFNTHDVENDPPPRRRVRFVEKESQQSVEREGISWGKALFGFSSLLVMGALTSYLTATAQEFYGKSAGFGWGWVLAVSFEIVILLLAFYKPRGFLGLRNFTEALRSVPFVAKWLLAKCALLGLVVYSYQVVTVDLAVAEAHDQASIAIPVDGDLASKTRYRDHLVAALPKYAQAGAVGSLRATQEQIEALNREIANLRTSLFARSEPIREAKGNHLHVTRIYRLIALAINVVLGHILAAAWFSSREVVA